MPILDKFKGKGVMGKIESGSVREGDSILVMPNKVHVKVLAVLAVHCNQNKSRGASPDLKEKKLRAGPGENVRIELSGIEEEDILSGFVLSSVEKPVAAVSEFDAQLQILELQDNVDNMVCMERFSEFSQLGRFTLRTEGKTVEVGKVTGLLPSGSNGS